MFWVADATLRSVKSPISCSHLGAKKQRILPCDTWDDDRLMFVFDELKCGAVVVPVTEMVVVTPCRGELSSHG